MVVVFTPDPESVLSPPDLEEPPCVTKNFDLDVQDKKIHVFLQVGS